MYPCRCRKCRGRKSFKRHPEDYRVPKRCSCGGEFAVDLYRMKREHRVSLCHCDAYWFPHRMGSGNCTQEVQVQGVIDLAELDKEFDVIDPFRRTANK